ncbi:MAG: polysaccharide deacetylase [Clostridia bacterium]|nr:polysaccharide deacetylase [Clostridia bacterium]
MSLKSLKRVVALLIAVFVFILTGTVLLFIRSQKGGASTELVPINAVEHPVPTTVKAKVPEADPLAVNPTQETTEPETQPPAQPEEATTEAPVPETGKIIYLTFDDGPGQYTERLLNILAKYNVKATFFVTHMYPSYTDLIGREAREGHAVAIHTYCHDYSKIYASDQAFWDDYAKMQAIILEQTGSETRLMRFPGGSSNTVSSNYSVGIMSRLAQQVEERGYTYFDWNVASGDAGQTTESAQVLINCQRSVESVDVSVLLCHDVKEYTVDAMDEFISWALSNGYQFRPLTADSYAAHHPIAN